MFFVTCIVTSGCTSITPPPIQIYAAVSMAPVLEEILSSSTDSYVINAASSSLLARQIEQGAKADIFVSASIEWIQFLDDTILDHWEGLSNELVLIQHMQSKIPCSLHDTTKLSIADWNHVPAGIYAKKALEQQKLFTKKKPFMVPAMNAHAALSYVASGHIPCGIVYKSDTRLSTDIEVVPSELDDINIDIQYSIARIGNNPRAKQLFTILQDQQQKSTYEQFGFIYRPPLP